MIFDQGFLGGMGGGLVVKPWSNEFLIIEIGNIDILGTFLFSSFLVEK